MTTLKEIEDAVRNTELFLAALSWKPVPNLVVEEDVKRVMELVKKYGDECAEDAPDCDSCNRIDPKNYEPERDESRD